MYLVCASYSFFLVQLYSRFSGTKAHKEHGINTFLKSYPHLSISMCLKKLESSERSVITEAAKMSKEDHFKPLSPQAEEAKRLSTFLFPDADRSVRINRKVQSCGGRS